MAVTLRFTVEDVGTQLDTYESIRVYRADTVDGAYSQITDITLVANQFRYSYEDSSGDITKWYKRSFHHAAGPVESSLSAPFQVTGTTRKLIRQRMMEEYGCGIVFEASAGGDDTVDTDDFRIKSASGFSTTRGKGTWLYKTAGDNPQHVRMVIAYIQATARFQVGADWTSNPDDGSEMEWHTMADILQMNAAINRGLVRYKAKEVVPIVGVVDADEYSLEGYPWIVDQRQVRNVRWYPGRASDVDDGLDQPWGIAGRWYGYKVDRGALSLQVTPAITPDTVLYLHCVRPMPELHTDASAPPIDCDERYAAALAWDELLAYLSRPTTGNSQERTNWKRERLEHSVTTLRALSREHRMTFSIEPAQLSSPSVIPRPWAPR